jgi:hypothetical protein
MNEIAEKTCKVKSENQVKGKVKAKTIITKQYLPYLQLDTFFKMLAMFSNTRLCPSV